MLQECPLMKKKITTKHFHLFHHSFQLGNWTKNGKIALLIYRGPKHLAVALTEHFLKKGFCSVKTLVK